MTTLSTIATYDDLRRCQAVLMDSAAEEEFLRFAQYQDNCRELWLSSVVETQRLQRELDVALNNMSDLETKLFHARRLLEMENKARKEAECERDSMEKKMFAVRDLVRNDREINDETRDKFAFLNYYPRKRKSINEKIIEEKYGNEINSTGSFLSDLSLTQSEDDFLNATTSKRWKKHRPSNNHDNSGIYAGGKRLRPSTEGKRKSGSNTNKIIEIGATDKIVAHTKVSVPQGDGPILAESIIEAIPQRQELLETPKVKSPNGKKSSMKTAQFTPTAPPVEEPVNMQKFVLNKNIMRPHSFASKTFLKTDTCTHCQKRIKFGSVSLKCKDCRVCIHNDCRDSLSLACVPQSSGTPSKGVMGLISDYTPNVGPMVPALIVHCVNEIETRGLTEVGIYRVSGSEREVKALKERFLRGKGIPFLGNIDVHVLCGCIKDFLRSLREPLIPTFLWKDFSNAVQNMSKDQSMKELYQSIDKLPQANRDTLAFLLQHFQRVAENVEVKMPITNIAKIFGPTIIGYSSQNCDSHAMYTETIIQFSVMERLLHIPTDYWSRFVNGEFNENDKNGNNNNNNNNNKSYYFGTPSFRKKDRKVYATPPYPSKFK